MFLNKNAATKKALEVLVQLILVITAAAAIMAFVAGLADHTVFEQQMVSKETALTALAVAASPAPVYAAIIHKNIDMDKFSFAIDKTKAYTAVKTSVMEHPYGGWGVKKQMRSKEFILRYTDDITLKDKIPSYPFNQRCKTTKSSSKIYLDTTAAQDVDKEKAQQLIQSIIKNIPSQLLSSVQTRTAQNLFVSLEEQKQRIKQKKGMVVALYIEKEATPRILYDINSPKVEEAKQLACLLSNELSEKNNILPALPVNLDFSKTGSKELVLDQEEPVIQVILSEKENQDHITKAIWSAVTQHLTGVEQSLT